MAHHERDSRPSNELSARDECAVPQDVAFPNAADIGPRLMRLNGMAPAVSAAEARRKLAPLQKYRINDQVLVPA